MHYFERFDAHNKAREKVRGAAQGVGSGWCGWVYHAVRRRRCRSDPL
jgi:hypothetical protein